LGFGYWKYQSEIHSIMAIFRVGDEASWNTGLLG
jgi:hypothetical protein